MSEQKYEQLLRLLLEAVESVSKGDSNNTGLDIPVGISNRHLHLSQQDLELTFGKGYQLTPLKELSQPGQYACKETVTICGPKGAIEKIRVLGPTRPKTQVEILAGDCFKLGVTAQPKFSGDISGTPGITIVGPAGSAVTKEGLMVAQRHIHMTPEDAKRLGTYDGEIVSISVNGVRGGILTNVAIRANDASQLECHLDTEEANALGVNAKTTVNIVR